mgnify:CR=1 FL=1
MGKPPHGRWSLDPALVVLTELGVCIAIGPPDFVFLPQQLERNPLLLELLAHLLPVGQRARSPAGWASFWKEPPIELCLVQIFRHGPADSGAPQVFPYRVVGDAAGPGQGSVG